MQVAGAAGSTFATRISKYFCVQTKYTSTTEQPAKFSLAASRRMDHTIQLSKNDCQAPLLELDSAACFFKLLLEVLGVVFRCSFLNG
jgi:hypothetical protein